jgi:glycosyltransferase involved in cell wall biosynthesis
MAKRVLILTYYWPPGGGAGVQRWLKFVKYLPEFGWEPVVYAPENPEYMATDTSLEKDIPAGTEIIKTRVWEPYEAYKRFIGMKQNEKINAAFLSETKKPKRSEGFAVWVRGNFFIPDARKFWIRPSVKYLSKYLKSKPVDLIVSTGPPHSMHLIGMGLRKKFNIPWIADFRDPWTRISYYGELKLSGRADRKHKSLEKMVLENADQVLVVSDGMKTDFSEIHQRHYEVIHNGFDAEDIPSNKIEPDKKFTVAHIGVLAKSRNPELLWQVLGALCNDDPDFRHNLEIKLVGKVDVNVQEMIRQARLEQNLNLTPYLPHDRVIEEQHKSAVLLLLIHDTPKAKLILTGKIFEYLSARRPILCIGPEDGDAANIISQTQSGITVDRHNMEKLKVEVLKLYNNWAAGHEFSGGKNIEQFSRKTLTEKLSNLLSDQLSGN